MRIIGSFLMVMFLLSACKNNERENRNFDTKAYFEQEIMRLEREQKTGIKTVLFSNDSSQVPGTEPLNWQAELKPFVSVNLADPAFSGSFSSDTLVQEWQTLVTYVAKDNKMEVREVRVMLNEQGVVNSVEYYLQSNNSLYSNWKTLRYKSDSGYLITGIQKVKLLDETAYRVGVKW